MLHSIHRCIVQYIVRKVWLHVANIVDTHGSYGSLKVRYNVVSCIPAALGGDYKWIPQDVKADFIDRSYVLRIAEDVGE